MILDPIQTSREMLESLRKWLIAEGGYTDAQVLINSSLVNITQQRCINLSSLGFLPVRPNEKEHRLITLMTLFFLVERDVNGEATPAPEDMHDAVRSLCTKLVNGRVYGMTVRQRADAIGMFDSELENVHVVYVEFEVTI